MKQNPTLILLPGLDGTGLLFEQLIRAFGSQTTTRVIAYPKDELLSYSDLRLFVKSALPFDAPFFLLAESFSGPIAITIASEGLPGLIGLVLCCTFARNPRRGLAVLGPLLNLIPFNALPSRAMSWPLLGKFATGTLRAQIANAVAQVSPQTLRFRMRAVLEVDVSDELTRVRVPCLYLRATDDRLVPQSASVDIQAMLPSVRISVLNGPHCLLQVAPGNAAQLVEEFLIEVAGSAGVSPYAVPGKPQSALNKAMEDENEKIHKEIASLSTKGQQRVVPGASHVIQDEQPGAVAQAVLEVLRQIK